MDADKNANDWTVVNQGQMPQSGPPAKNETRPRVGTDGIKVEPSEPGASGMDGSGTLNGSGSLGGTGSPNSQTERKS